MRILIRTLFRCYYQQFVHSLLLLICFASSSAALPDSTENDSKIQPYVSNVFFETDLRQALKDLADEAGIPIIPDKTVQGLITLEFNNEPLENVLNKILSSGGYTFKKYDGYYLVGSPLPENSSFPFLTQTEHYIPGHILAEQIPGLLSDYYHPFVRVNNKTNSVAITASPELISIIKTSIARIDVPPRQISIEAVVTELSDEAKNALGMDWNWLGNAGNEQLGLRTNYNSISNDSSFITRLIRTGVNYKRFNYNVILQLKALATDGKAKIKANPKISTINGKEATIFIGRERYFSIVTGPVNYPYTRLEKIPAGITLKIIPRASCDDEITATIECEVSEVNEIGTSGLPLVTKRNAQTTIRVKSGEIIAIGGLNQEYELRTQKKIPLLGSIPLLGYVFSHTIKEQVSKEIAIFISAHLISESQQKAMESTKN
ncbi:hypothetical protein JXJ21_17200 [candidate division KSB1 bacterium]|nr:hypothetical protein [candidate division KSB1 bacterium]